MFKSAMGYYVQKKFGKFCLEAVPSEEGHVCGRKEEDVPLVCGPNGKTAGSPWLSEIN